MEYEVISLDHSCRYLFPIVYMDKDLSESVGMIIGDTTMNGSINGDNIGMLILAGTLPPKFTPGINYYASKDLVHPETSPFSTRALI